MRCRRCESVTSAERLARNTARFPTDAAAIWSGAASPAPGNSKSGLFPFVSQGALSWLFYRPGALLRLFVHHFASRLPDARPSAPAPTAVFPMVSAERYLPFPVATG